MRRRARKCPMPGCGVKLTDKPGLPNSKHLDHIAPLNPMVNGTHSDGNVRIICARCNLKRPKDGSDFTGQLTLWAVMPGAVSRRRVINRKTCRKGLHPWIPENIKVAGNGSKTCLACYKERAALKVCKCGASFSAPGSTLMCPDCSLTALRTAAVLRIADWLTWNEIAERVGYASGTGIRDAVVRRIGNTPGFKALSPPRTVQARPQARRCACGEPLPKYRATCGGCAEKRAMQAAEMYQSGMTLREIADRMGCSSITTVSNLVKSAGVTDMRIGRRSKLQTSSALLSLSVT